VIDTLIAATARNHHLVLLTRDAEQARIAGVEIRLL
jgi:predicted nucleic acid-binding protein